MQRRENAVHTVFDSLDKVKIPSARSDTKELYLVVWWALENKGMDNTSFWC